MREYKMSRPTIETTIPAWRCLKCGYIWPKKSELQPIRCARCRSPYWGRPKKIHPKPHIPNPAEEFKPNV